MDKKSESTSSSDTESEIELDLDSDSDDRAKLKVLSRPYSHECKAVKVPRKAVRDLILSQIKMSSNNIISNNVVKTQNIDESLL